MTTRKELGRITHATFGMGGYQDAMMGLSLTFGGDGWGVGTFEGHWADWSENCKWTLEDQGSTFAKSVRLLRDTLRAAKKTHVAQLVGTPVEVTFEDNVLSSWRVLTEVI